MEIKVLGPGCAKCKKLYDVTVEAAREAGVEATVTKVEQLEQIAAHGIAFTPGLVIDGQVVASGKVPRAAQIVTWIRQAGGQG